MSDTLPPLPEPAFLSGGYSQAWSVETIATWPVLNSARYTVPLYSADQMREYAAAALAAAVAEPVAYLHEWKPHAGVIGKSLQWRRVSPHGDDMQVTPLYAAPPQREPLREGEVMGAYMDFDRTADRAWTNAEYLVRFGLHISKLTAHGISAPASAPKEQA